MHSDIKLCIHLLLKKFCPKKKIINFFLYIHVNIVNSPEERLLHWCNKHLPEKVKISNFTTDFQSGLMLMYLLNAALREEDRLSQNDIENMKSDDLLKHVLGYAEEQLKIPQLLDVCHILENPDKQTMMTYISLIRTAMDNREQKPTKMKDVYHSLEDHLRNKISFLEKEKNWAKEKNDLQNEIVSLKQRLKCEEGDDKCDNKYDNKCDNKCDDKCDDKCEEIDEFEEVDEFEFDAYNEDDDGDDDEDILRKIEICAIENRYVPESFRYKHDMPGIKIFIGSEEERISFIIGYWIRTLQITFGWINEFDKIVIRYYTTSLFNIFCVSSKLLNTLTGHTEELQSIDYKKFNDRQLICSGSCDKTVRVWDVDNNKQIQLFDKCPTSVNCVKFSSYHYNNNNNNVICISSNDRNIRFWDFEHNNQLKILYGHKYRVNSIEFSSFNGGRYLCSGSLDNTVGIWDIETYKSLHFFKGHKNAIYCIDISPVHNNNNNNNNNTGIIGGNGYTVCSGSSDKTIRIWDIETTKQLILFKGHDDCILNIKYGSDKLLNTILSGSMDRSVRLWDIRSGKQIQVFNGHTNFISAVEYSPFIINNICGTSNVICSASIDNTIRFWDFRLDNRSLHIIKGCPVSDNGIKCIKFVGLKNTLFYGSFKGLIRMWS
ncbi:WD-40 repeat-containing protein [Reticulomyxa filosa]|uniref:Peroxin-7 n=1 Tax=Reticulomyxa filosa TaxID=46433 RepID=X6MPP8_RETFI|nr:WD-40 repeat-containing protein [Reticulomyxa filosa]|eukprot:ETO15070.1 WD-40 repeat-containing protein [Reticulomyxa filosa]